METQLELFDTKPFSIHPSISKIQWDIVEGWRPFCIDTVQKAAMLYGVSCGVVLDTYERVIHDESSNDPDD